MWRGVPKVCCSRNWLCLSSRKYVLFVRTRSGTDVQLLGGDSSQASASVCSHSSRWFATEAKPRKEQIFDRYDVLSHQTDSDCIPLTDNFGLLSVDDSNATSKTSLSTDEHFFSTLSSTGIKEAIPTTLPRGNDSLTMSVRDYFENLEGDYDISGILHDFAEANAQPLDKSSSHWLSAVEQMPVELSNKNVRVVKPFSKRLMGTPVGLRQRHLLARWRTANRKAAQQKVVLSREVGRSELSPAVEVDEVEAQDGFLLCSSAAVGASAMASEYASATETVRRPSYGFLQEEMNSLKSNETNLDRITPAVEDQVLERPHVSRERFDPLEVRAKVASSVDLRRMTHEKDIHGLRALLNEYRWPDIQSVRPFVNELFEVFIDRAADVDEIKFLIWDFAATDNRAFVADAVTLCLLERIVREEGLHSAGTYARHHRDLFLVRPPMERKKKSLTAVCEKLFATAIQASADASIESARHFIDLLIELGYLERDNSFFLYSLNEELKRGFNVAFERWSSYARNYRTSDGMHLLIRALLKDADLSVQEKNLGELLEVSLQSNHPYAALGEVIVELVIADRLLEAELLFKKLTISGRHLRTPLNRMEGEPANLVFIEKMGELVTNCLFAEQRVAFKKKTAKPPLIDPERLKFVDCISQFLIAKWTPRKKKKYIPANQKTKKYIVDPEQVHELSRCIQNVWADLAGLSNDIPSLNRLHTWCLKNNVEIEPGTVKRCVAIYSANNEECPFTDNTTSV